MGVGVDEVAELGDRPARDREHAERREVAGRELALGEQPVAVLGELGVLRRQELERPPGDGERARAGRERRVRRDERVREPVRPARGPDHLARRQERVGPGRLGRGPEPEDEPGHLDRPLVGARVLVEDEGRLGDEPGLGPGVVLEPDVGAGPALDRDRERDDEPVGRRWEHVGKRPGRRERVGVGGVEREPVREHAARPRQRHLPAREPVGVDGEVGEPPPVRVDGPEPRVEGPGLGPVALLEVVGVEGHPLVPHHAAAVLGHRRRAGGGAATGRRSCRPAPRAWPARARPARARPARAGRPRRGARSRRARCRRRARRARR